MVNFYHRFLPGIMRPLNSHITGNRDHAKILTWDSPTDSAFRQCKDMLANATLLHHPKPDATTSIATDASDMAVGAVLQQLIDNAWCPLAYFSKKLQPAETKYSTFDRELLAVYLSIKHFRHFVEGREFHVLTDHKPLTFSLNTRADKHSPRQARHLSYISQFTDTSEDRTMQWLMPRGQNPSSPAIDFTAMAREQLLDNDLKETINNPNSSSLKLEQTWLDDSNTTLLCDSSTGKLRPLVPSNMRRLVFDRLHSLSHPGIRATQKLVADKYVWSSMQKDMRRWTQTCLSCQRAKIHQHTTTPLSNFTPPSARFDSIHIDLVGPLPPSQGFTYLLTCIDRFTHWPEAIPLAGISANSVATAFIQGWIARFGIPSTIRSPV